MQEIYTIGSTVAVMRVYEDFGSYSSGIYQHIGGKYVGNHAVKLIGWGEENGVKYWIAQNSWNPRWGESGYFRILKGENHCFIEYKNYGADPIL